MAKITDSRVCHLVVNTHGCWMLVDAEPDRAGASAKTLAQQRGMHPPMTAYLLNTKTARVVMATLKARNYLGYFEQLLPQPKQTMCVVTVRMLVDEADASSAKASLHSLLMSDYSCVDFRIDGSKAFEVAADYKLGQPFPGGE